MKSTRTVTATCPVCDARQRVRITDTADVARTPAFREQVLAGTFLAFRCKTCNRQLEIEHELVYRDIRRGLFCLVLREEHRDRAEELETLAQQAYHSSLLLPGAPATPELDSAVQPRLVFGYEELREKVLCAECGLDDRIVEAVKVAVSDAPPRGLFFDGVREDGSLAFTTVVEDDNGALMPMVIEAGRALYDELEADAAAVRTTLAPLFAGPYVNAVKCWELHP